MEDGREFQNGREFAKTPKQHLQVFTSADDATLVAKEDAARVKANGQAQVSALASVAAAIDNFEVSMWPPISYLQLDK